MQSPQGFRKRAPRLLLVFTALMALSLVLFAPVVIAEDHTSYTAEQIEDWLKGKVAGSTLAVTNATISLSSGSGDFNYVKADGVQLDMMGLSVGLNPAKFKFDGSTSVDFIVELNLFGIAPAPKILGTAMVACDGSVGTLEVTDLTGIMVGSFEPDLTAGDTQAILDVINQIIVASGLSVSGPSSATLEGISVVDDGGTDKLKLTWSNTEPTFLEETDIRLKMNGMIETLGTKANGYLEAEHPDWWINVEIPNESPAELRVDAGMEAFGVTASVKTSTSFDELTATVVGTEISVGSKMATFSADMLVGNTFPSIETQHFTLNPDPGSSYSGLAKYVNETIQDPLIAALDDAFDDIVEFLGYGYPYPAILRIEVAEGELRIYPAESIQVPLELKQGWNLVSIPVAPVPVGTAFPGARIVYMWDAEAMTYSVVGVGANVEPGRGYWVAMEDDSNIEFEGAPLAARQTLALVHGWNMVGVARSTAVDELTIEDGEASGVLMTEHIYSWDPTGKTYGTPVSQLEPGKGYWLAATGACTLIIP